MISQNNGIIMIFAIIGLVVLSGITSYQNIILSEKLNSVDVQLEKLNTVNEQFEILVQEDREIKNKIRVLDENFDWFTESYIGELVKKIPSQPDMPDDTILKFKT